MNPLPSHIISALNRRGIDPTALAIPYQQDQSPASPGFDPSMVTPQNPGMPDRQMGNTIAPSDLGQPGAQAQQAFAPQQEQNPMQDEASVILSALVDRLKHHSSMSKSFLSTILKHSEAALPQQANG